MHNINFFKQITNLNNENITFTEIKEENNKVILSVRWKYTTCTCPSCWIKTTKRKDKVFHPSKQNYKHMPYGWNKIIELKLLKRHFRCNSCKIDFYEKFSFESLFWFYTTHFEKYIQWNWWFVSWNKLSELYQTSNSVIYSILEKIDVDLLNQRWMKLIEELDEIYLWVDEHSFSGHDMILVITELKTREPLAILDWITKEKLEAWILSIPPKYQIKIKWFNTDMNKGYVNSLLKIIWNPIQWVDKFHFFWEANKVIDQVRQISIWSLSMNFVKVEDIAKLWKKIGKKLTKEDIRKLNENQNINSIKSMQKYKDKANMRLKVDQIKNPLFNSKWEEIEYKEITPDYFIETGYRQLFMYREKNLSDIQKLRLNQIFREFDYLGFMQTARTLKEDFMDAMDETNLEEIDRIMNECLESEHYRIKQFWRTLKRWYNWIKGFFEHSTINFKFTNAFTEGFNNLCKVAKRQAHWFKLKSMYFKKLVAKFCIKNLEF